MLIDTSSGPQSSSLLFCTTHAPARLPLEGLVHTLINSTFQKTPPVPGLSLSSEKITILGTVSFSDLANTFMFTFCHSFWNVIYIYPGEYPSFPVYCSSNKSYIFQNCPPRVVSLKNFLGCHSILNVLSWVLVSLATSLFRNLMGHLSLPYQPRLKNLRLQCLCPL